MDPKKKSKRTTKDSFESMSIKCPFFKAHGERSVCCEGVERGSKLELSFRNATQKQKYVSKFCSEHHRLCLIARMNDLKYDEDGILK